MGNRVPYRDGRAETIVALQNKMADLKAEIARLRARPGWREGVEAAAAVAKAHGDNCLRDNRWRDLSADAIEAAIRALKEPTDG